MLHNTAVMANEMEVGVAALAVVSVSEQGQGEILTGSLLNGFRQVEQLLEGELATVLDNLRFSSETNPHDKVTQREFDLQSRATVRKQLRVATSAKEWLVGSRAMLSPNDIAPGAIVELSKDGQRNLFLIYNEARMPGLDALVADPKVQSIVGCELAALEVRSPFYLQLKGKLPGETVEIDDDPGWVVNII